MVTCKDKLLFSGLEGRCFSMPPQGECLTGHAGETGGLSGGLGSSQQDHLSVLTLFSSFRGAWLPQK